MNARSWISVLVAGLLVGEVIGAARAAEKLQTVQFALSQSCRCVPCVAKARKQVQKMPGVRQVQIDVRRRLMVVRFDEAQLSLRTLQEQVHGCDLGKKAQIALSAAKPDLARLAEAAAALPEVAAATPDAKRRLVLLQLADGEPKAATLFSKLRAAGVAFSVDGRKRKS